MKKHLFLLSTGMILLGLTGFAWAQCPEDTIDSGICDTLYVKFHDPRQSGPLPWEVHVPILVTHDVPDPALDSIQAFVIPLKITHTNPTAYCSIPLAKNNTNLYPFDTSNSIFRHFGEMENRMMNLAEQDSGFEWDFRHLDIQNEDAISHFYLALASTGSADRRWWEGSKTLLATITLLVEDSMTICIDTCFWPPSDNLAFARSDAHIYVPRHLMPVCQKIFFPTPPWFASCPDQDQQHNTNGHFASDEFEAYGQYDDICLCTAEFVGQGVENATIHYHDFMYPPGSIIKGHVEYDVTDHYQAGGYIRIGVMDIDGEWAYCSFNVVLFGRGDCNTDGTIDIADVVYLINYLFIGGSAPDPLEVGDTNCDGVVNIADVVYLINYLFMGGPPPSC